MNSKLAIDIQHVSFSYGGPAILEDVSFTIGEGDFACLIGPNGGGKTTLLKLMLGLLHPARGEVRVLSQSPRQARPHIGYMPQRLEFDSRFPITVLEVVLMGRLGLSNRPGFFRSRDVAAAKKALQEVDLAEVGAHLFSTLSGGQQQRVLIARALVAEPRLLLLDEPTANLDLRLEGEFYKLLQAINQRFTVVLVSHDLGFVAPLAKKVICVNRRVAVHPVNALNGDLIKQLYGGDVHIVRHDQHLDEMEGK